MATKSRPGSRNGLIHCDYCGEDYSDTYKRCPFCDEYMEDYEQPVRSGSGAGGGRGGKRLAGGRRRGGISVLNVIGIILSLAVIIAAIWIVTTKIVPMISRGDVDTIDPSATPPAVSDTVPDSGSQPGGDSTVPDADVTVPPAPEDTTPPASAVNQANGLKLNSTDVTLYSAGEVWTPRVSFTPAGTTADVTWESDNTAVAKVSADGVVTAVAPGKANITATLPNGVSQTAIVRCRWTQADAPSPEPTQNQSSSAQTYSVNNPDFTLYRQGETYRLKIKDYTGNVSWSSSNTSVATVAGDGTCTAVGTGTCTVTGTLSNGSTAKAIVRVKLSG